MQPSLTLTDRVAIVTGGRRQLGAAQAISRLAEGESIDVVMAEFEGSGTNAGDLGWVNLAQVPGAFGPALRNLGGGEFSAVPIASEYGWHVIYLDAVRDFSAPPLDQVEEGIRRELSRARLERYMDSLRARATIERPGG